MSDYKDIYDNTRFRKGFRLIEEQSDEKRTIARYIVGLLQEISKENKSIKVLDLAGGAGSVWKDVQDILSVNGQDYDLSLKLVDSSEEQTKKAASLNIEWLTVERADATSYIKLLKDKYDLITCIHFLPGLPRVLQRQVFNDCKTALSKNGVWLGVQPNINNPLTQAKTELIKNIVNKLYVPMYTVPDEATLTTIPSKLTLQKEQTIDLAYFLTGKYGVDKDLDVKLIDSVFSKITNKAKDGLEITLLNDYLIFKND